MALTSEDVALNCRLIDLALHSPSGRITRLETRNHKNGAALFIVLFLACYSAASGSIMHASYIYIYIWFDLRLEIGFFTTFSSSLHYILRRIFVGGGSIQECMFNTGQAAKLNLVWSSLSKWHISIPLSIGWHRLKLSKLQRTTFLYRSTCIAWMYGFNFYICVHNKCWAKTLSKFRWIRTLLTFGGLGRVHAHGTAARFFPRSCTWLAAAACGLMSAVSSLHFHLLCPYLLHIIVLVTSFGPIVLVHNKLIVSLDI